MTDFESAVLEQLSRMEQQNTRLENRMSRMEKSVAVLSDALPKLILMVDALHTDYLVRTGLIAKEE